MKILFPLVFALTLISFNSSAQSILKLGASESMGITGKGAGQDAAVNPFADTESTAIIENIGNNDFVVRIQENGEIIGKIVLKANQKRTIALSKGVELYLDSDLKAVAKIDFEKRVNE